MRVFGQIIEILSNSGKHISLRDIFLYEDVVEIKDRNDMSSIGLCHVLHQILYLQNAPDCDL